MKTLNFTTRFNCAGITSTIIGIAIGAACYYILPFIIQWFDNTAGTLDNSIWLLLLFSMISFLLLIVLCAYLLIYFLSQLGLPKIKSMVLQFKNLSLCQQFAFYWASFALLLLASVMSLVAVF